MIMTIVLRRCLESRSGKRFLEDAGRRSMRWERERGLRSGCERSFAKEVRGLERSPAEVS